DGNRYIDATAAFGVATTGHANPAVARAIAEQAARLPHGMGDVHPSDVKTRLLARLAALAPLDEARAFLCSTGSEAVEFALKSAYLAVGEPNVLAFEGGYHGLSYGALEVGGIAKFREPWRAQLRDTTTLVPFPDARQPKTLARTLDAVAKALKKDAKIGAVIVEPIQGRAGVIVPPDGFLPGLRELCTRYGVLLILDEIYTGLGRTGTLFACEREVVQPDILCVGKALGGGFPISATLLSGEVASAWQPSTGEALHTSTYLGNPMGCAAALANLTEIESLDIPRIAREREPHVAERLRDVQRANPAIRDVRGRGMLWALEFADASFATACVVQALARGLMILQSGVAGATITFAPPPVITEAQLERAFTLLTLAVRDPLLA
ncbi:MAG: aspartate aminotransferase family protein, partial [Candidatus Eremiobacteraeota bacterium]|nr:aspartate aminotransferase family protein [Candidatus Eremiobacteraeota bacterium]